MQPVVVCLIRPTDLSGRLSGGLRRFVEVGSRIDTRGVKYVIVESEPFLKSFPYFTRIEDIATKHTILGVHMPWQACMSRRVLGPILFWLNIAIVAFVLVRVVRTAKASLVLAPGETIPEVLATWVSSRISGRRGAVIVQSDPFLLLGQRKVIDLKSYYAAYRTTCYALAAFLQALTAGLYLRAVNDMGLLVVGQHMVRVLSSRGITGAETREITGGADLDKVRASKPLGVLYDVVLVGRIDPSKGIMEFLHNWTKSRKNRDEFKVALVGPIQERLGAEFGSFVTSHEECMQYLGTMTDTEVIGLMKSSRVLVMPSYFESFSLVVVEALASGIPVVCYDSPSIREFFPTSAVCVVPPRKTQELVEKVRQLLENEEERLRLSTTGMTFASRYDWADVGAREAQIYRDFARKTQGRKSETTRH